MIRTFRNICLLTLAVCFASSASANTQLFTDNFTRANAATWGNGWIDPGAKSSIASNAGIMAATTSGWNGNGLLYRPTSDGNPRDQQITITIPVGQSATAATYIALRVQPTATTSTEYVIGVGFGGTLKANPVVSGTLNTTLAGCNLTFVYNSAHTYQLTGSVIGVSPTTVAATLTDTTSSTTVQSCSTTDSTAALQSPTTGQFGVFSNTNPTGLNSFTEYSVSAATTYTLAGPASGVVGSASNNFTVTPNGPVSAATVVTPSDGGAGGTFTPTTVTFANGSQASQTFTYTASAIGVKTLSTTNNNGLTDPASVSYNAVTLVTLPVNSSSALFSPGNWKGDTGRAGSVYRQTWNIGSSFSYTFTASANPIAKVLFNSASSTDTFCYYMNTQLVSCGNPVTATLAVANITPSATNTFKAVITTSTQANRWNNGVNTVQVTGFQIDSLSSAGTAPAARPWVHVVSDSIGVEGVTGGTNNHLFDYTYLVEQTLNANGYDVGQSGCGFSGWIPAGDSTVDVPGFYVITGSTGGTGGTYNTGSRWNKIDNGVSLLDSNSHISSYGATGTEPALILINLMTNDAIFAAPPSDSQAAVTQGLTALRAAAPNAQIVLLVPFGLAYSGEYPQTYYNALINGFSNYQTANPTDTKTTLLNLNISTTIETSPIYMSSGLVHPLAAGHALLAPMVATALLNILNPAAVATYAGGFHP